MKKQSEKADLKLNIQKTKIVTSGRMTSCQIDGEKVETVTDFFFFWGGGSKTTADGDCSHEIKRCLLTWRSKWQPTPVLLPGKFYGLRSLVGYSPWGCKRVRHNLATKQQKQH